MAVILRYFSEFGQLPLPDALRESSRSLSHLLMSSCTAVQLLTRPRLAQASRARFLCDICAFLLTVFVYFLCILLVYLKYLLPLLVNKFIIIN